MKYVALLRGINVGGKNTIKMAELKICFERLRFNDVTTYINSGNVIFSAQKKTNPELASDIATGIKDYFGLDVPAVVRTSEQIDEVVKKLPKAWTTDKTMRTDVIFLWDEVDYPAVIDEIKINPEVDNLIYIPCALIWNLDRQHYTKSKMHSFIGTKIYKLSTARNSNTVRKLQDLMQP